MRNYETVVEAINDLINRGYSVNLNVAFDSTLCVGHNCLNPDEFTIVETYRFEGDSNPSDEEIVFALSSNDSKKKGIFTGAFGTYATNDSRNILKHVHKID